MSWNGSKTAAWPLARCGAPHPLAEFQSGIRPERSMLPVELDPGLELERGVHQEAVRRLVTRRSDLAKAGLGEQDVGRAEDLAADQRLGEKSRHERGEGRREAAQFAPPRHRVTAFGSEHRQTTRAITHLR